MPNQLTMFTKYSPIHAHDYNSFNIKLTYI